MIGVFAVLLMMLAIPAFLLGAVVLAWPQPKLRLDRRWKGGALMGGAFTAFMLSGFMLPQPGPVTPAAIPEAAAAVPTVAPVLVAKADPAIRGIDASGEYLVVDMWSEAWSDEDHIFAAGGVIKAVGHALQAGATDSGQAQTILLTISTASVDRLGNEGEMILVSIFIPRSDLMAAKLDNLTIGRILNLAEDVRFPPQGLKVVSAYCLTDRGLEQSRAFCGLANRRLQAMLS